MLNSKRGVVTCASFTVNRVQIVISVGIMVGEGKDYEVATLYSSVFISCGCSCMFTAHKPLHYIALYCTGQLIEPEWRLHMAQ